MLWSVFITIRGTDGRTNNGQTKDVVPLKPFVRDYHAHIKNCVNMLQVKHVLLYLKELFCFLFENLL